MSRSRADIGSVAPCRQMVLELTLNTIGADEDVTGDQGVMKHRVSEGEGYEKPTDGAKVTFHVRVMPGSSAFQGGIREGGGEEEGKTEDGEKTREEEKKGEGKRVDYSKWDTLEVTDDGEVVQKVPPSAEKALAEAKAAQVCSRPRVLALSSLARAASASDQSILCVGAEY